MRSYRVLGELLLWKPERLPLGVEIARGGPVLSVEFARISGKTPLTLVSIPEAGGSTQVTCWADLAASDLEQARLELKVQEGTPNIRNIHALERGGAVVGPVSYDVANTIREWLVRTDLDAVTWTGLEANWEQRRSDPLSGAAVVQYLREISRDKRRVAEEYIRKAPEQIRTRIRQDIEEHLGWTPLSTAEFFEP